MGHHWFACYPSVALLIWLIPITCSWCQRQGGQCHYKSVQIVAELLTDCCGTKILNINIILHMNKRPLLQIQRLLRLFQSSSAYWHSMASEFEFSFTPFAVAVPAISSGIAKLFSSIVAVIVHPMLLLFVSSIECSSPSIAEGGCMALDAEDEVPAPPFCCGASSQLILKRVTRGLVDRMFLYSWSNWGLAGGFSRSSASEYSLLMK